MLPSRPLSRVARIATCILSFQTVLTTALEVNVDNYGTLRSASKAIAKDIFGQYTGDQPGGTPGILPNYGSPDGYYWWVGGGLFSTMVNYWHHTGDDTYNEATRQAISWQSAPDLGGYFEPSNQSLQLGNDDISFWAFAALGAAEYNFPPPTKGTPDYIAMVQGVFNRQAFRWDNVCGGGLRWQATDIQGEGYHYKNSISNGCFFQIAARLAKYTGNSTYSEWAEKTYDWTTSVGLIDDDYAVYDGIMDNDCEIKDHRERWSYNVGVYLYGAAIMWNITQSPTWEERLKGLIEASNYFMKDDPTGQPVATETICELSDSCEVDQSTFKGYMIGWMYDATNVAPWSKEMVDAILAPSAPAAAISCTDPTGGLYGGAACGEKWYTGSYDGLTGIGMNMNAMEAMFNIIPASGPLSLASGANSKGDASAGTEDNLDLNPALANVIDVTTADKAGAAILSIILTAVTLTGAWWIVK